MSFELTKVDYVAEERAISVARTAIDTARSSIAQAVNHSMVDAYWIIAKEITVTTGDRAEYGRRHTSFLSRNLTAEYRMGFSESNLRNIRQLYRAFPIRYAVRSELSWTNYRHITGVKSLEARESHVAECAVTNWSERELMCQRRLFEVGEDCCPTLMYLTSDGGTYGLQPH